MSKRVEDALVTVWLEYHNCINPALDDAAQWSAKQTLYEFKFAVDDALSKCPMFDGEEEFLENIKIRKAERRLSGRD